MSYEFSTRDPLDREIVLKTKTWNNHIVPGHPEVAGHLDLIKKTVEDPKYILKDRRRDTRENYLDLCSLPHTQNLQVIKVVVDFSAGIGSIVTAYPTERIRTQASTQRGVVYDRP